MTQHNALADLHARFVWTRFWWMVLRGQAVLWWTKFHGTGEPHVVGAGPGLDRQLLSGLVARAAPPEKVAISCASVGVGAVDQIKKETKCLRAIPSRTTF